MITATIKNGPYPQRDLINMTFSVGAESIMAKLSEIGIGERGDQIE